MININAILIKSLKSKNLNFKKLLINKDTIIWRNCDNLNIKVTSKINKFQFDGCTNITLYLMGTIAGLELNNCKNFILILPKEHTISAIELYKSRLTINGNRDDYKRISLLNEHSQIDFMKKR